MRHANRIKATEKIREGPQIIDLLDSCSPQEHQYTSGWRDRMGNAKRRGESGYESAYALGWDHADKTIRNDRARRSGCHADLRRRAHR